jgi:hypothetical protein
MTDLDLANVETLGPAMTACTERERKFALALGSGAAETYRHAALLAGYSDVKGGARVRAHVLMQRERVRLAIREVASQYLENLAGLAVKALRDALTDVRHPDRFKTASTILSRLGWGENSTININAEMKVVDHKKEAIDDLRACIRLGLSEEKLLELFGFTGLGYYRRLMEEEDAKSLPAPIEATAAEIKPQRPGSVQEPVIPYRDRD